MIITNKEKRLAYSEKRLNEVTKILNDIADKTGFVYVAVSMDCTEAIFHLAGTIGNKIVQMGDVVDKRFARAKKWERGRNKADIRELVKSKKGVK